MFSCRTSGDKSAEVPTGLAFIYCTVVPPRFYGCRLFFFCTLYLFHFMHNHLDLLFTLHQWWITTSLHYCCFRISVTFILQSRLGSDLMTFPFRAKFLQGLFLFTNTFSFCKDFLFAKTFSFYKYVFFLQIRFLFAKTFSFYRYVFCLQIFYFSNSLKRLWRLSLWSSFCKEDSYQRRKCQKKFSKIVCQGEGSFMF